MIITKGGNVLPLTKASIVKEVMGDVKEQSFVNLVTINRDDLKSLIQDAVERGIELGIAQANKPKIKLSKKKIRGSSADDEFDILQDQ